MSFPARSLTLVTTALSLLLGVSCRKPTTLKRNPVTAAEARPAEKEVPFDESKYSDEQRILDPDFGRQVLQPDSPSTMMTLESSEVDARIVDVNLSLNVWGVGSDSMTTTNLAMHYTPNITLFRHTPRGDNMILDAEGNILSSKENTVVAQCGFDAMVISTATGRGSLAANPRIPFIGAGGGTTVSFEKTVEDLSLIMGSSNLFPVRKGETVQKIQELCRTFFDASQKESLEKQAKTIVEKKFVMDERTGLEKVMKQAIGGPKDLLKDVNGLEFNVDTILASVKNGGKTVEGGLKNIGDTIKDKGSEIIGGIGGLLNLYAAEPAEPMTAPRADTFNLCFVIHMDKDNNIKEETYTDCNGGAVRSGSDAVRRAIQVAQEIGMTAGQYSFSAKDF